MNESKSKLSTRYANVWEAAISSSFWSKLKETNVFLKHILKAKARDQSIQANKKLFCQVIEKNFLCKFLCKLLIKIKSTWKNKIKEQTPQLTLLYFSRTVRSRHRRCSIKKAPLKNFTISTGNTCVGVSFLKSFRSST